MVNTLFENNRKFLRLYHLAFKKTIFWKKHSKFWRNFSKIATQNIYNVLKISIIKVCFRQTTAFDFYYIFQA
jgi:hypothetical protein